MSQSNSKLKIILPTPYPQQAEILWSKKRFIALVAGRRSGKTTVALEKCFLEATKANAQIWYISPTYRQSKQIAWKMLLEFLNNVPAKKNETELSITLPNNATIALKGGDSPDSLRGVGLNFVVLDEYSDIKPEVWEEIIRPTLADTRGGAWFIGTPRGKNHFYELWTKANENRLGSEWSAYRLKTEDNPYIPRSEIELAKSGDERIYRQEWLAEFEAFAGKFFTEFDERIHVVDPYPVQPWWRKIISVDYGYVAESAVLWAAIDQDANVIIYKEFYTPGYTYERLAQEIVDRSKNEHIEVVVADPSIWSREGTVGKSGAEYMQNIFSKHGIPLLKADNERKIGWGQTREYLKIFDGAFGQKTSRVKIFKTCYNLIREIPSAVFKGNEQEDLECDPDHCLDSLRYNLMYLSRVPRSQAPLSPLNAKIQKLFEKEQEINPNRFYELSDKRY